MFVLFLQIKPGLDNKGEKVDGKCFCRLQSMYFYYFLQIKQGLDNKGEKVDGKCFCKDCNLCLQGSI